MLWHSPRVATADFEKESGWEFKPEGACKGEVCIPLAQAPGAEISLETISTELGMPLVKDEARGLYALGPESIGSRALTTAKAPSLVLPDVDGKEFDLASLLGKKVLVYAWAPY